MNKIKNTIKKQICKTNNQLLHLSMIYPFWTDDQKSILQVVIMHDQTVFFVVSY